MEEEKEKQEPPQQLQQGVERREGGEESEGGGERGEDEDGRKVRELRLPWLPVVVGMPVEVGLGKGTGGRLARRWRWRGETMGSRRVRGQ